jgi:hypothetical protein
LSVQTVLLKGEERHPTISTSYVRRLHESPAPEIDIGTFRQSALLLVSDDMGGFHFDLNGIVTEQAEDTVRRAQLGKTLSISHSVGRFTVSGGAVAFLPAVDERECGRQPLGRLLSHQKEPCSRCWVQPRLHQHLDPVGGVRWFHLCSTASPLERARVKIEWLRVAGIRRRQLCRAAIGNRGAAGDYPVVIVHKGPGRAADWNPAFCSCRSRRARILGWAKRRTARQTSNRALAADAVQSATCDYLAATTLAGLAINAIWNIHWADSAAALLVLPIVIVEGRPR